MKTRKYRRSFAIFGIILLLIGIELGIIYGLWWRDTHEPFTIEFQEESRKEEKNVHAAFTIAKKWDDFDDNGKACVGAQYDGIVRNNMDVTCTNWQLVIKLPKELRIDSSWNGKYTVSEEEILVIPDKERNTIEPGGNVTIGFVGYSFWPMNLTDLVFVGYRDIPFMDYAGVQVVLFAGMLWVFAVIAYTLMQLRLKQVEAKREKDERIIEQMMNMFAGLIDTKDEYTKGHSARVAHYAKEIARRMQLGEEEVKKIGYIAMLHDCGKIGIPDQVLQKPESLTGEERTLIEEHTIMGGKVLENFTAIDGLKDGALYHHERYDGTGYPFGLKGNEIPFYARIIGVADSFDTMNSDRVYRNRLTTQQILEELKQNSGTQFDPEIVKYMIEMIQDGFTGDFS